MYIYVHLPCSHLGISKINENEGSAQSPQNGSFWIIWLHTFWSRIHWFLGDAPACLLAQLVVDVVVDVVDVAVTVEVTVVVENLQERRLLISSHWWLASCCFVSSPFPWLWSIIVAHESQNNDLHHPYHGSVKLTMFKSKGTSLGGTLFRLHESWRKGNWKLSAMHCGPRVSTKLASTNNWISLLLLLLLLLLRENWVLGWGFKLYKTGATKFAHQIGWLLKRVVMPNMWLLCTQKSCCTQRQFTQ